MNKKLIPVAMSVLLMQGVDAMAESVNNRQAEASLPICLVQNPNDSVSSIEIKVKEVIAQYLKIDKGRVGRDSDLVKDLGADSLDVVEIVMQIEENFSIEISDKELNGIKKVCDILAIIENRKKEN